MNYEMIDVEINETYRKVTIDRGNKPNPIDGTVIDELNAAVSDIESSDTRVVSIHGSDGVFASGADLAEVNSWFVEEQWDQMLQFVRRGQQLVTRIDNLSIPTIAAIDGAAIGGGCELALGCDFRFATDRSVFQFAEIDLGMIPGWGGTQRLPDLVGESTAKDLLLTGREIEAGEAQAIGLVNRVVSQDELESTVEDYANQLAEKPPKTMQNLLAAVETGRESPMEAGLAYELMSDMLSSTTAEAQQRTRDFLERQRQ